MSYNNSVSLFLLRGYQKILSPWLPRVCRFEPSCSVYAVECFGRFGWGRAFWYSLKRILRCHPYCEGGIDPVPEKLMHN